MITRLLMIPAIALAAVAFVAVDAAQASPFGPQTSQAFGPRTRVHVGGGVTFPINSHGGYWREHVQVVGGYYETRTREVHVPGGQIGWDMHGRPLYGQPRVQLETYQVWVPQRNIVRRVYVPARSHGFISVGGGFRLR